MQPMLIAIIGGLAGMFGWGLTDFFGKGSAIKIGHIKTVAYSQLIGLFLVLPFFLVNPAIPALTAVNLLYILLFSLGDMFAFLLLYKAFEIGEISMISPISSAYVILSVLIGYIFLHESFPALKAVSIVLVIVGIFLTSIDPRGIKKGTQKAKLAAGVPQALAVFFIWGFWYPLWSQFIQGKEFIFWLLLFKLAIVGCLFAYMAVIKRESVGGKQKFPFILLLLMGFFDTLALIGNTWAFSLAVDFTSIIIAVTAAYPLVAVILGHLFYKERLSFSQYIGIAGIICGVILLPFI